jgi:hypothetical protein
MRRIIEKLRALPLALALVIATASGIAIAQSPTPTLNVGSQGAHVISAATTNATSVTTARSVLTGLYAFNPGATIMYLKLHDLGAAPTPGTTPVVRTYPMPQNVQITDATLANTGMIFNNGIAASITALPADADTGASIAGGIVNLTFQLRPTQ